jgi:hypothetical protein
MRMRRQKRRVAVLGPMITVLGARFEPTSAGLPILSQLRTTPPVMSMVWDFSTVGGWP